MPVAERDRALESWWVLAPTVVTHGLAWPTVGAPGPRLPAEAATKTPAAVAWRNASSTESVTVSPGPETE